jgi:aminopeptidase N
MENTTATVHYDALQRDSRALLDETHEDIIAHELVHHWFGDLVTCESWANLTLNEGFATFGEFLWIEHKYGADEAAAHIDRDLAAYLAESAQKREPLVRYRYIHRDDMFDAHSYQKGGRVLLMLRRVLGKEAFYAGLKQYLTQHAYSPVELAELRMAFEDVTGQDLNWFFDTWFLKPGHPELSIQYTASASGVTIQVKQTQDTRYVPIFRMPVVAQVMMAGGQTREFPLWLETADTTYRLALPAGATVTNVDFDSEHYLLATVATTKPKEWWMEQYRRGSNYKQKQEALSKLMPLVDSPEVAALFREALNDPYHGLRAYALEALQQASGAANDATTLARVRELATRDPKAAVRLAALSYLAVLDFERQPQELEVIRKALNDSSYAVVASALGTLYTHNQTEGLEAARRLKDLNSDEIRSAVADIFLSENATEATDYVLGVLRRMGASYEKMFLMQRYGTFLASVEDTGAKQRGIEYLKDLAKSAPAWYIRFMAARSLMPFRQEPAINEFLQELKRTETHPRLREMYQSQF